MLKNKAARCLRAALYSSFNYAKITGAPAPAYPAIYQTENLHQLQRLPMQALFIFLYIPAKTGMY